jgi:hypothetical protein
MITIIYFQGKGFTEYKKEYLTLSEAIEKEGVKILEGKVYKNNKLIKL